MSAVSARRAVSISGFVLAIGSAASFALSGIFASALMAAGWSAGAAVTTRVVFASLVLLPPTLIMLRGSWSQVRRAWKSIVMFGVLAVGVCQLAFFLAVQYIAPSLALLIEFMGPVLLMLFIWARTRRSPGGVTLVGAGIAVLGLIAVSGLAVGGALHPLGIFFGLLAAVGAASYFALGAKSDHGIAALPFTGLGLAVAAVVLVAASAFGVLPFAVSNADTTIAGAAVPAWVAVAGLVLISTVLSYVLGVAAARRLGATVASFTGYSEPMFGILWTIALLAIVPTGWQWVGAGLIIAGVVTVKIGESVSARRRSARTSVSAPRRDRDH
ncbi:MAG: EamA family transporter [Leucobacter sp.]|nr:EamA family transporter [Leucobacter sp.]